MGAEQSVSNNPLRKRSQSLDRAQGAQSPQLSIASDLDAPYASSTINRPIGDSPKRHSSILSRARATDFGLRSSKERRRTTHFPEQITVVNVSGEDPGSVRKEVADELKRFEDIPQFLPILRGALKGSSFLTRSRDDTLSLEKIDCSPLLRVSKSCQEFLTHAALISGSEQNRINAKIRDVSMRTENLMTGLSDRQRRFSKYAEGLSHVHDISRTLRKCHATLAETISLLDSLNEALPPEDRLEPFQWGSVASET